jgi:peptidoglycan/LPS O-acetylase OafA/YrhL
LIVSRGIPSLDGLRAVSIALVIVGHVFLVELRDGTPGTKALLMTVGNGSLGVDVFFCISGFLITSLLKSEVDRSGRIDLINFYIRRSFRIFPAFYCYLLVILGLGALGVLDVFPRTWASSAVYLRNYWPPFEASADWFTGHAWSLAVEEQFYLFWPACFALLGRRYAVRLAALMIALFPASRLLTYALLPGLRADLGYMTHTRGDALMVGCLAALLIDHPRFRRALDRAFALRLPLVAIPFLLVVSPLLRERLGGVYLLPFGYSLEALAIVVTLLWLVERPGTPIGRLLNTGLVKHVGIISYSLYLWQQLFTHGAGWWSLPATLLAAEASYRLIERPFLRLRDRLLERRMRVSPQPVVERSSRPNEPTMVFGESHL